MAPGQDTESQLKFLIACVKHSNGGGKVDFQAVAAELDIVSKGAAAKRYERLLKAHDVPVNPAARGAGGDNDAGPSTPANRKRANAGGPSSSAKKRKGAAAVPTRSEEDDDEEVPLKQERVKREAVKKEEEEEEEEPEATENYMDGSLRLGLLGVPVNADATGAPVAAEGGSACVGGLVGAGSSAGAGDMPPPPPPAPALRDGAAAAAALADGCASSSADAPGDADDDVLVISSTAKSPVPSPLPLLTSPYHPHPTVGLGHHHHHHLAHPPTHHHSFDYGSANLTYPSQTFSSPLPLHRGTMASFPSPASPPSGPWQHRELSHGPYYWHNMFPMDTPKQSQDPLDRF